MTVICKLPNASFIKAKPATRISAITGSDKAGWIKLSYVLPMDKRRVGYIIKCKTTGYPENHMDGDTVYDDSNVTKENVTFTYSPTNFTDGVKYYFCIYTYTYKNSEKVYTTKDVPRCTAIPKQTSGKIIVDTSKVVDVPYGVTKMTAFIVGGGAGGNMSGGGSGYGNSYEIDVSNLKTIICVIGAGGLGASGTESATNGGESYILVNSEKYSALGGYAGTTTTGGSGGSGGGGYTYVNNSPYNGGTLEGGAGGENGTDGKKGTSSLVNGVTISDGGKGSGKNTSFDGIIYSGGGGGGCANVNSGGTVAGYIVTIGHGGSGGGGNGGCYLASDDSTIYPTNGTDGTGAGGGGRGKSNIHAGDGGCGIIILKW